MADFDGALPVSVSQAERAALWQEIESRSQEDLEKDVHERQSYILCRDCRERWASDPLGRGISRENPGRVH